LANRNSHESNSFIFPIGINKFLHGYHLYLSPQYQGFAISKITRLPDEKIRFNWLKAKPWNFKNLLMFNAKTGSH
jgi:hypothetical protein